MNSPAGKSAFGSLSQLERAERINKAMNFDMIDVLRRYVLDERVSKETAREHERELKRYLLTCVFNTTGKSISMAGPVDKLWHTFILFTKEYEEFCQQVAGRFLHHSPALPGENRTKLKLGYERFQLIYTELFNESPPDSVWPSSVSSSPISPACPEKDVCSLPPCSDPVPCDNRECNNCTGSDTDQDSDSDDDDDRDKDEDIDVEVDPI